MCLERMFNLEHVCSWVYTTSGEQCPWQQQFHLFLLVKFHHHRTHLPEVKKKYSLQSQNYIACFYTSKDTVIFNVHVVKDHLSGCLSDEAIDIVTDTLKVRFQTAFVKFFDIQDEQTLLSLFSRSLQFQANIKHLQYLNISITVEPLNMDISPIPTTSYVPKKLSYISSKINPQTLSKTDNRHQFWPQRANSHRFNSFIINTLRTRC